MISLDDMELNGGCSYGLAGVGNPWSAHLANDGFSFSEWK